MIVMPRPAGAFSSSITQTASIKKAVSSPVEPVHNNQLFEAHQSYSAATKLDDYVEDYVTSLADDETADSLNSGSLKNSLVNYKNEEPQNFQIHFVGI